jgi:hypothetical protein
MAIRKLRRVFTGTRSQKLRKLANAFQMLSSMDQKEERDAEIQEREPDLFITNNKLEVARQRLLDQAQNLLALKR